jgi:hypothetical protein
LLGRATPTEINRGKLMPFNAGMQLLITVHPSCLLHVPDEFRADSYARAVQDMKLAVPFLKDGLSTCLVRLQAGMQRRKFP